MRQTAAPFLLIAAALAPWGTSCGGGGDDDAAIPMPDARQEADAARDVARDEAPDAGRDRADMEGVVDAAIGLDERPIAPRCVAPPRPRAAIDVELERVFAEVELAALVGLERAPGEPGVWYAVEQAGRIVRIEEARPGSARVVFDERSSIDFGGERGLLGLAFHPEFATNRRAFISYVAPGPLSRIAEVRVAADGTFEGGTGRTILLERQPYGNHNGGAIAFGPDGMLYIALGDGGSGGDPLGHGQNTETRLGSILRIDVSSQAEPYASPPDNPFASGGGAPEIYAWGLRNPWRISFDPATGTLWTGDVGQRAEEEVNVIERGGNYGWRVREGSLCFNGDPACDDPGFVEPVVTYGRSEGKSITGGYVYRGTAIPALAGRYLYADFVSGRVWALGSDPETGRGVGEVIIDSTGFGVSSFAQDPESGEVYVLDYGRDGGARIFALRPGAADEGTGASGPPELLSETGCVDQDDPSEPAVGLLPYRPSAPFYSDGASKRRWVSIPAGAAIEEESRENWEFPVGTVFVKSFERGGRLIETRLFVRHDDGGWAGYTYAWRDDGSDAELVRGARLRRDAPGGGDWLYPSRADCLGCHTEALGRVLGFRPEQLAGTAIYSSTGRRAPQLDTLRAIGLLDPASASRDPKPLVDPFGQEPLDWRARSYLQTNCASCHVEGGPARGELRLKASLALPETGLCDPAGLGDLGLGQGARLIEPGAPERSVLRERMRRADVHKMPPAGLTKDEAGIALIESWIADGPACSPPL